jgi:hypothetical protein
VRERASHVQRVDKTLQDANLKLGSVLTDIMGQSGRAILDAIAGGETDPHRLVVHIHRRVKAPRDKVIEALQGKVTDTHRFLLKLHLGQADALQKAIEDIDGQVDTIHEPLVADAICDRLVHNAHVLSLKGESGRKKNAMNTTETTKTTEATQQ